MIAQIGTNPRNVVITRLKRHITRLCLKLSTTSNGPKTRNADA